MDQALIDYAVSHGYTREEAIAHYGKKQSSDSPSADWALKQGQQNIADQPESLQKLKEPDVKGAVTEMVPAAANTAKESASSMFQGLDTTSAAIGAGAGALGYGLYKTLGSKISGGGSTPAAPAAPAVVAPPAARGSLSTVANNPAPVEGMPGMRENYTKPKGINPVTGEPFIGPGGYNWLASQVGFDAAPQMWEEQYGKRNVPHAQVQADYSATRYPPTAVTVEGQSGGTFGKPKYIPEYIKGAASPAALATTAVLTALPALGVAAVRKYQGNEAAVNASLQEAKDSLKSLATMPYDVSKAALKGDFGPLKDLMLSVNPGSLLFNEMDKKDEEILKKMIQKEKVGAGRGMQGVPPPNR